MASNELPSRLSMDSGELAALMTRMRPKLHRYCARMVGSAFDGEDVVQEAFMRAAGYDGEIEHPERWLMRIAHNAALDDLRRKRRAALRLAEVEMETIVDRSAAADVRVMAEASLAAFLVLPPLQRSMVILGDVLGHPLVEMTEILGITDASAKAALHRGRAALKQRHAADPGPEPWHSTSERARLRAYADRFNARDFDALRALLAEDVRLDLANRGRLVGREVGIYFTRYSQNPEYGARICLAEGRLALAISDPKMPGDYVVLLEWRGDEIAVIRDYRHAPYIAEALKLEPLN